MKITDKQKAETLKAFVNGTESCFIRNEVRKVQPGKIAAIVKLRELTRKRISENEWNDEIGLKEAKGICDDIEVRYLDRPYSYYDDHRYWGYSLNSRGKAFIRRTEEKFPKNPWGTRRKFLFVNGINNHPCSINRRRSSNRSVIWFYLSGDSVLLNDSGIWYDLEIKDKNDLKEKLKKL